MITHETIDSILVKIMYYDEDEKKEKMLSSYYTTAIDQTIRMYKTMKELDIEGYFNDCSSVVADDYKNTSYFIENIFIHFGSSEDIPVIEVWIK